MRKITCINDHWKFQLSDGRQETVNLPHTWNDLDGQDGGNDYYRGTGRYTRGFSMPEFDRERETVYLEFCGVNASARVEVNGTCVGEHDGGYSTFRMEIGDVLEQENILTVTVDNSVNDRVYPQKADFTFYGGIYRDVNLIVVNRHHFALDYFGTPGLRITPQVEGADAKVTV